MKVWIVEAYTPYEGSCIVAVLDHEPSWDELTALHKTEPANNYESIESEEWTVKAQVD